jgi:hypothetical protein
MYCIVVVVVVVVAACLFFAASSKAGFLFQDGPDRHGTPPRV